MSAENTKLHTLPLDIKCHVFSFLQDALDVRSLALTHREIYLAFTGSESHIIKDTLQNQFIPDVLREVIAVALSMKIQEWSRATVQDILHTYFDICSPIDSRRWKLSDCLSLCGLQKHVKHFTAEFAGHALSENPARFEADPSPRTPSFQELIRFERTFWRFELYSNLFRLWGRQRDESPERFCVREQKSIFFDRFAPHENEQLGCVRDYLIAKISVPFNDFARHDIGYGEIGVKYDNDYDEPDCKEAVLSRGLDKVRKFLSCNTYEEQYEHLEETGQPFMLNKFLYDGLQPEDASWVDTEVEDSLETMSAEEDLATVKQPFHEEKDHGPYLAWRWAYIDCLADCYFLRNNWYYRQRAIVMWDEGRLIDLGLFNSPRYLVPADVDHAFEKPCFDRLEVQQSRSRRTELFMEGCRGWWSKDDESRVKWPESRKPKADWPS